MAGKVQDPKLKDQLVEVEEVGGGEELSFFDRYRNIILGAGALIVLVVLALVGLNVYNGSRNGVANEEMFRAINAFESDSLDRAISGGGQFLGLEEIASEYSGTEAANQANYYLGVAYLKSDSLDDAIGIEYLEKVSGSNSTLAMSRDIALAFAYERQENFSKAASLFKRAAYTPKENDQTTPYLLLEAGRCYELAGDAKAALGVYTTIKEDFSKSTEALRIDKYIGRVSP